MNLPPLAAIHAELRRRGIQVPAAISDEALAHPARSRLITYVENTFPGYDAAPHIVEMATHLEAIERGDIDRLLIIEPPRHGKSLLVSQRFPAWYMGRNPTDEVIHCSYGGELVSGFGRRLRNLMLSDEHTSVFPECRLATDSKAANLWHTSQDGVYVAAGVGGPITGRGAHLLLIDDPVKSREEAESETMRNRAWDWYQNDAYTRLMRNGGRIVCVSTRWHEDDLVGRLLNDQAKGGDQWTMLHHQAIRNDGSVLWPAKYPLEVLERTKRAIGPRAWQSLYQGDPTPEAGAYFKRDWITMAPMPPKEELRYYGASDYAVTDDGGDYTVHAVVGIDTIGRMWLVDLWRKQTTSLKWIGPMLDMMVKWNPVCWAEEKGQIEKAVGPFLLKEQMARKVYTRREQFTSATDKPTRARSIQGRIEYLGLYLPHDAPWASTVETELLKFPTGTHDDIVDTLSLIGRMVAGLEHGKVTPTPAREKGPGEITLNDLIDLHERDRHWMG